MLNWYLSTFSSRFHPVEGSGRGLFRYYTTSNFSNVRFKNYLISGENLLQPWCQINGADGPNKSGEVLWVRYGVMQQGFHNPKLYLS